MGQYFNWAFADWLCRDPIARLVDQALQSHPGFDEAGGEEMPPEFLSIVSGVRFLHTLLWEVNLTADETLSRCRSLLETALAVIDLVELLFQSIRKQGRIGAHQGLTFDRDARSRQIAVLKETKRQRILAHISKAHDAINEVLSDLRASKLAAKRVSEDHFWGRDILLPAIVRSLEEVSNAACHSSDRYNRLLDRIFHLQISFSFSPELGESGKINFRELEEVARHKAEAKTANLIGYAATMMRLDFSEQAQVLDELKLIFSISQELSEIEPSNLEAIQSGQSLRDLLEQLGVNHNGVSEESETFDK